MTEATLIYNPNAGLLDLVTPRQLEEELQEAGYAVEYRPTETVEDLDAALAHPNEVVVTAGGDGTVRAAALRLMDREVSMAIVPMGTANNIAHTLGIEGSALEVVAGLENPQAYDFDVGRVEAPWGEDYFLELFGLGFFAHAVTCYGPQGERTLPGAFWAVAEALADYRSHTLHMTFDGQDLSGDYLIVNLFNTPLLGPGLELVHEADPGDGALDLLCIGEGNRAALLRSMTGLLSDGLALPPDVDLRRGKRLRVAWDGFPVHVDAEARPQGMVWPDERDRGAVSAAAEGGTLSVEVRPGALQFLLPRREHGVDSQAQAS
jgi:diacylglycerol kinase family enzyme